jgi:hypothetical protein
MAQILALFGKKHPQAALEGATRLIFWLCFGFVFWAIVVF